MSEKEFAYEEKKKSQLEKFRGKECCLGAVCLKREDLVCVHQKDDVLPSQVCCSMIANVHKSH